MPLKSLLTPWKLLCHSKEGGSSWNSKHKGKWLIFISEGMLFNNVFYWAFKFCLCQDLKVSKTMCPESWGFRATFDRKKMISSTKVLFLREVGIHTCFQPFLSVLSYILIHQHCIQIQIAVIWTVPPHVFICIYCWLFRRHGLPAVGISESVLILFGKK